MPPVPQLQKLPFVSVPFEAGRRWRGDADHLFQEKADGQWMPQPLEFHGHWLVAEQMRPALAARGTVPQLDVDRPGAPCPDRARYVVHNIVGIDGEDVRHRPLRERWAELVRIARDFPPYIRMCRTGAGGEFLEAIVAEGGEGVCVHDLNAPWGAQAIKCKRSQVFYCAVTELNPWTGAARIGYLAPEFHLSPCPDLRAEGDAGWLPLRGGKFDRVRVGSVLKVEAYGRTANGLLREARLDKDTPDSWLVRY
jgi:hypothetical protein